MVSTLLIFAICFVQRQSLAQETLPQPEVPQQAMPQQVMPQQAIPQQMMPQLMMPLPSLPFLPMMQQPFPKGNMCPFNIGSVIEHSAKCGVMVNIGVGKSDSFA